MTSQGTCHVHFHPLTPLLLYLGHHLVVVPAKAFSLNGVWERELPWWAKSGLGELMPAPSTILVLPPCSFHPLSVSQLELRLTGEA